jgi:hypothetical protein
LEWVLKGGKQDDRYPLTPFYRDYLIAKKFGYTFQEIQEQPAAWLDWLLVIDGKVTEIENDTSHL